MKVINKSLELMKKKETHCSMHICPQNGKLLKLILKIFKTLTPVYTGH